MRKAKVSYTEIDGCTPEEARANKCDALRGHKEIRYHIVFDVKMDFTRKARFVAGGHMTDAPSSLTYSSVVSRECEDCIPYCSFERLRYNVMRHW